MSLDLLQKYQNNISQIDKLFDLPERLRDIFVQGMTKILEDKTNNYTTKTLATGTKGMLETIHASHLQMSDVELSTLLSQSLVLVVSNAESLLKEAFSKLLVGNLESLSELDDKVIPFKEIRKIGLTISRKQWAKLLLDILWQTKGEQKPNFQNIETVIGLFNGYFGVELSLSKDLKDTLVVLYQFRHVIVHNASIVDGKLINELNRAKITHKFTEGQKVVVSKKIYEIAKTSFEELFKEIENKIRVKKLEYEGLDEITIDDIPF